MSNTEDLQFSAGLDTRGYDGGIRRVIGGADGAASKVRAAFSKLSGPLNSIGGQLGGLLAGGAVIAGINELANGFAELGKQAAGVPLDPERYQRLGAAFLDAGVEGDDFAEMLRATKSALSDAAEEGSEAAKSLAMLGLSQDQIKSGNVESAVYQIAEAFKTAGGDARVFMAANSALGEDLAAKVIPVLSKGSEHLLQMGKDAKIAAAETIQAAAEMQAARNKFFTEASNVIGNEVFAKGQVIKIHMDADAEVNPGGVVGGLQKASSAVVGLLDALTGGHLADKIARDRMSSGPVSDEEIAKRRKEMDDANRARAARDALSERQEKQKMFEGMQSDYVKFIDGEIKAIHDRGVKERTEFEEATYEAHLENMEKKKAAAESLKSFVAASQETSAIQAELAGQQALADEIRTRAQYEKEINDARERGHEATAKELEKQMAMTLEMKKQAAVKEAQLKAEEEREKKIDERSKSSYQRREERRQEQRRQRIGRSIDQAEINRAETERKNREFSDPFGKGRDLRPGDKKDELEKTKPVLFAEETITSLADKIGIRVATEMQSALPGK